MRALVAVLVVVVVAVVAVVVAGSARADDAEPVAPLIVESPTLTEGPVVGEPLAVGAPIVENADAADVTLRWERARGGGPFAPLVDAHASVYVPQVGDVDAFLRVCARVETAGGVAEACSAPSLPVRVADSPTPRLRLGRIVGLERIEHPFAGETVRADVDLGRWIVRSGDRLRLRGAIHGADVERAFVRLQPTVPGAARWAREAEAIVTPDGRVEATIVAGANSIVILRLASEAQVEPVEIRIGVVGVRPRIALRLGARSAGRDATGRRLIRDLRLLPGSTIAPGQSGLRLRWEGMLPGRRGATSVCRRVEGIVARVGGALRGRCAATGAWATARWRLVYDPGTDDPGATAWLAGTSAWVRPRTGRGANKGCATLPTWNSPRCNA